MSTHSGASGAVRVDVMPGERDLDSQAEERLVSSVQEELLAGLDRPYLSAMAIPEFDENRASPIAVTVHLSRADVYLFETARLSLDADGRVTNIEWQSGN